MRFVIDVHLHSRYARATSRDLNPENLHRYSALKGVDVVGTGDYTHPAWLAELQEKLEPAEQGLYQLREAWRAPVEQGLPERCRRPVRFLLSVEISSIYKKNGRTRKIHNVVILPGFEEVEKLNARLGAIGNLKADGRPILGLDSRDLLEICLEVCPRALFVPAHIWTPHFAVLGASSGFDTLEECYEDLLPHIFAVETGLSSDPPMNARLSALDGFAVISNSDAHSPQKLAREATCFDAECSYDGIYDALRTRDPQRFTGTLEFYPEEGKYHCDGHRKCGVCWQPAQTLAAGGLCPECGRPLTVGVLHRVEKLADRSPAEGAQRARPFEYLIPLDEVVGAALGVGPRSKKAMAVYDRLLEALGPELEVLRRVDPERIEACGEELVAEGVRRMRQGRVHIEPGHDGEYGRIQVFTPQERERLKGQGALFDLGAVAAGAKKQRKAGARAATRAEPEPAGADGGLDAAQQAVVEAEGGPLVVVAGPGSGKTRTLTHRIAHLVGARGVEPGRILAVTFTHRAAGELRRRLQELLGQGEALQALRVGTFHRIALDLLSEGGRGGKIVLDEVEARWVLETAARGATEGSPGALQTAISLAKAAGATAEKVEDAALQRVYGAYQNALRTWGARDYDDLLLDLVLWLEQETAAREALQQRFSHLLVDEFQDVNAVQYRLVRLLAGAGGGLLVIGDGDQAIYGFRGAEPRFFRQLEADFPGARRFHLGSNYRSQALIVRAAAALVSRNPDREALEVRPVRPEGAKIRLLEAPGETAEGIAVVRQIGRMVGGADMVHSDRQAGGRRSFADFAVLFRTQAQGRLLEQCFLKEGLPYRLVGQKGFLQAASVRQALVVARYLVEPDRGLRRRQALEVEPFHPGREALEALERGREGPAAAHLKALEAAAERYRRVVAEEGPAALFRCWAGERALEADADLAELARLAGECASLTALLEKLLLGREADYEARGGRAAGGEAVSLMTLHAAKGLEFPVVFICGVEAGLLPYGEGDVEEERRLFYVGLTRAREEVVLLSARRRTRYGRNLETERSPFVGEVPAALLEIEHIELPRRRQTEQLSLFQ